MIICITPLFLLAFYRPHFTPHYLAHLNMEPSALKENIEAFVAGGFGGIWYVLNKTRRKSIVLTF